MRRSFVLVYNLCLFGSEQKRNENEKMFGGIERTVKEKLSGGNEVVINLCKIQMRRYLMKMGREDGTLVLLMKC